MMNRPLNRDQVKEITLDKPHVTLFPNRQNRRERISKRNMSIQTVPLFDTKGMLTGFKEVLHEKLTNLPRNYPGMSRINQEKLSKHEPYRKL